MGIGGLRDGGCFLIRKREGGETMDPVYDIRRVA